jgi:hypothetical protein
VAIHKATSVDLWKIAGVGFLLATAIWLTIYLVIPPCFPGADIFNFKDAGINLASGLGFVTRMNPGNPGMELSFYATYTPLYPLLYGIFVKVFGVGPKVNRIFDFLLTAGAGMIFFFALVPRFASLTSRLPSLLLLLILLVALPAGPLGAEPDRPEALSLILTVASWLSFRPAQRKVFTAALTLGINGLVMPFGFILNALGLIILFLAEDPSPGGRSPMDYASILGLGALGAGIPLACAIILIAISDPFAITRFLDVVSGKSLGGRGALGYFLALLAGDVDLFLEPFQKISMYKLPRLLYLGMVSLVAIAYFLQAAHPRRRLWQTGLTFTAMALMALIPILVFSYESCYMGFSGALMLVLLARLMVREKGTLSPIYLWLFLVCVSFLSLVEGRYAVRDVIVACQSGPSYERMQRVLVQARSSPGQQPVMVATAPSNYLLFKSLGFEVVDIQEIGNPSDRAGVQLFALSFVGTCDPLKPDLPRWGWDPQDYELLYRPALPQQTKFWGSTSSSSNTWEVELYRRK